MNDVEAYAAIDEILWKVWDPAHAYPDAPDEYRAYLPGVFDLFKQRASAEEIADYLDALSTQAMKVNAKKASNRAATAIVALYHEVKTQ